MMNNIRTLTLSNANERISNKYNFIFVENQKEIVNVINNATDNAIISCEALSNKNARTKILNQIRNNNNDIKINFKMFIYEDFKIEYIKGFVPCWNEPFDSTEIIIERKENTPTLEEYIDGYRDMNHDNPNHKGADNNIVNHMETVYMKLTADNIINSKNYSNETLEAARYHDIGKFITKEFDPKKLFYRFFGHDGVSSWLYLLLKKEDNNCDIIKVALLIALHMQPFNNWETQRNKFIDLYGSEIVNSIEAINAADRAAASEA